MQKLNLPKGVLVVFEGIDGCGKTTIIDKLYNFFLECGLEVIKTKEPTDGTFGKLIRESAKDKRYSPKEENDLFIKDRIEHINNLLLPVLKQNKMILLDRYYYSNIAYQGARGLDKDTIKIENEKFTIIPDVLFILSIPLDKALERIKTQRNFLDKFEDKEYLLEVQNNYDSLKFPYQYVINADDSLSHCCKSILIIITELLFKINECSWDIKKSLNHTCLEKNCKNFNPNKFECKIVNFFNCASDLIGNVQ